MQSQRGRSTTSIFSNGASLSAIPQGRERECFRIRSKRELRRTLRSIAGGTILFHGLWRELTAEVQYELSTWTLRGSKRATAVSPIDLVAERRDRTIRRWLAQPDIVFVQPTGNFAVRRGNARQCTDLEALELVGDEDAPAALFITGHGAEHCVQVGSLWLCTDSDARLPGPVVDPRNVCSPLVFLNSCASLRMGDSTVPVGGSLAATLYSQGSTVIGTFRNVHTTLEPPRLLMEGLMCSEPLGSVVRNVNVAAVRDGAVIPPYQILGNPALKTSAGSVPFARRKMVDKREIQAVADNLASTELLAHTITSWFRPSDALEDNCEQFNESARYVFGLCHDQVCQSLSTDEINDALQTGRDAAATLRASLLQELQNKIQTIRWLEICYAPVSKARISRQIGSGPKTSLIIRHVYRPMGRGMLAITRDDCGVRGTLREWLGTKAPGRFDIRLSPEAIIADACPLAQNTLGTFFIHRTSAAPVIPWPHGGGRISFAVDELPFKGRVTVVAARIGPRFVHFEYRTVFIPTGRRGEVPDVPSTANAGAN